MRKLVKQSTYILKTRGCIKLLPSRDSIKSTDFVLANPIVFHNRYQLIFMDYL